MLIKVLKSQKPLVLVLIPVIFVIFWFNLFYDFNNIEFQDNDYPMPLFKLFNNSLSDYKLLILSIITVLILLQAIYLNRINTKYILIEGRSYSIILIYILLVSSINFLFGFHPVYLASIFVLIALDLLFKVYKNKFIVSQIFTAGLSLGLGSLLCFELIYLMIPFWLGISILRSFNLREWIIFNIACIIPHIFVFSYFFLLKNDLFYYDYLVKSFKLPVETIEHSPNTYLFAGSMFIFALLALIYYLKENYSYKISSIKYFNVLLIFLLASILLIIIMQQPALVVILVIPMTFLLSNYVSSRNKSLIKEIVFTLLFLILVVINHFDF